MRNQRTICGRSCLQGKNDYRHTSMSQKYQYFLLTAWQSSVQFYVSSFNKSPTETHLGFFQLFTTSIPHFIVIHRCFLFYKLKTSPSTSKEIDSPPRLPLLPWTKPARSQRYACILNSATISILMNTWVLYFVIVS